MVKVARDGELMLAVGRGDLSAFNEIVQRHQGTAWRVAYRFLGDSAEAEDIAQEAFLRILTAAPQYKPTASFSTYLYRFISRLCIDNSRKMHPLCIDTFPEQVDSSPDPATTLDQKDQDTLIRKTLDALPSRQRMAVILKYYEDLSYADIAHTMGTTTKAVERMLGRARKTLQSSLSQLRK
jgi:RNA polymerase sigma-70 factor (ECF subfamily)